MSSASASVKYYDQSTGQQICHIIRTKVQKKSNENYKKIIEMDRKSLYYKNKLFLYFFNINSKSIFYFCKISTYISQKLPLKLS